MHDCNPACNGASARGGEGLISMSEKHYGNETKNEETDEHKELL